MKEANRKLLVKLLEGGITLAIITMGVNIADMIISLF